MKGDAQRDQQTDRVDDLRAKLKKRESKIVHASRAGSRVFDDLALCIGGRRQIDGIFFPICYADAASKLIADPRLESRLALYG